MLHYLLVRQLRVALELFLSSQRQRAPRSAYSLRASVLCVQFVQHLDSHNGIDCLFASNHCGHTAGLIPSMVRAKGIASERKCKVRRSTLDCAHFPLPTDMRLHKRCLYIMLCHGTSCRLRMRGTKSVAARWPLVGRLSPLLEARFALLGTGPSMHISLFITFSKIYLSTAYFLRRDCMW